MGSLITRKDGIDPYPNVLLHGQLFLAIMNSVNYSEFEPIAREWLAESQIGTIDPEAWYPRQHYLTLLKKLEQSGNTTENQISIGIKVIESAQLPPDLIIHDATEAIGMLTFLYLTEQRNLPDGESGYSIRKVDDRHYEILDTSPYTFHVNYGFIWGVLRRFIKQPITLTYEFMNKSDPEMGAVLFKIQVD